MKRFINWVIAILALIIAVILTFGTNASRIWAVLAVLFSVLHMGFAMWRGREVQERASVMNPVIPDTALTEVVLLGEDDSQLASWNIYGKNGIVIGRDVGENDVTINLNDSVYASMIDVEHAVLNYSGNNWYIEDISERNGISIQKRDGRKYKLAYGKLCRLEKGDVIYVALTKLQIL